MGKIVNTLVTNIAGAGNVPPKKVHLKRYPFVFLIDVSGSTGVEPDPDINHINAALASLTETLRNPTPSSELHAQIDMIDVCIIAYSDDTQVILPWSLVDKLPASLPPLSPLGGTAMAKAIERVLARSPTGFAITATRRSTSRPACPTSSI